MSGPRLALGTRLEGRPRLDVYARLLPMGAIALDDAAAAEIADNPFLEFGPERSIAATRDYADDVQHATRASLAEHIEAQLLGASTPAAVRRAAHAVIGSLDREGYCRETPATIASIARCGAGDAAAGRALVQSFDPLGVAARDLGERFVLQLDDNAADDDARTIARELEALAAEGTTPFAARIGLPLERVIAAVARLAELDPRPTRDFGAPATYVRPDFLIARDDRGWRARLDPALIPDVRLVSPASGNGHSDAMRAARAKARRFVDAVARRTQTLTALGDALVAHQATFLDAGGAPASLAPLTGRALARGIGCAESTISRALSNRYARTPFGTLPLRAFLAAAPRATSTLTTHEIVRRLGEIIATEREPLSDRELARRLALDGIRVARRTVAKYRLSLEIASSRSRIATK